jgi:hypothetical protein
MNTATATTLTAASHALFIAFAKDAGNWGGTPMVNGNVTVTQAQKGNLTDLKKAGLLTTFVSDDLAWVDFTDAGKTYAKTHGVTIRD